MTKHSHFVFDADWEPAYEVFCESCGAYVDVVPRWEADQATYCEGCEQEALDWLDDDDVASVLEEL